MLIGRDDISNDIITLAHVCQCLFTFALIEETLTALLTGSQGYDVITKIISAKQHFALTFSMQIFKFYRHSCKLFFLCPPCRQIAPRACSQANLTTAHCKTRQIDLFIFIKTQFL